MGQPAARATDSHPEGEILEGSTDVLIGGLPAARQGDKVSHGKGTEAIAEGEATVLINGRPAARQGDTVQCGGVIVGGCASVLIGRGHGQCLAEAARSGASFVSAMKE